MDACTHFLVVPVTTALMGDSKCGILVPTNILMYGLASRHEANPILSRHLTSRHHLELQAHYEKEGRDKITKVFDKFNHLIMRQSHF